MTKYCPKCGTEIDSDAKFCHECGQRIVLSIDRRSSGNKTEIEGNVGTGGGDFVGRDSIMQRMANLAGAKGCVQIIVIAACVLFAILLYSYAMLPANIRIGRAILHATPTPPTRVSTQTPTSTLILVTILVTATLEPISTVTQTLGITLTPPVSIKNHNNFTNSVCFTQDFDCGDFPNNQFAQAIFELCMAQTFTDVHKLDLDGDGIACESDGPTLTATGTITAIP